MKTESGIPITNYEEELPEEYKIELFSENGNNSKMEDDIDNILTHNKLPGPEYVINVAPFKYKPKMVVDVNGDIIIKKKDIAWIDKGSKDKVENKENITTPKATELKIKRINVRNESILEDIINFLGSNSRDEPSKINEDITQSIINEWVKQFMSLRSVCCYEKDINILFNDKSKAELVKGMFPDEDILLFDFITDGKLLRVKENLSKGVYIRKNNDFEELTKHSVLKKSLYILLSVNGKTSALLSVRDNINFKAYFPTDIAEKLIIDSKLKSFFESEGFNYIKDEERKITKEQKKFLPAVDLEIWREDFCIFALLELLEDNESFDNIKDNSITPKDYSMIYLRLANFAMGLK